VLPPVAGMVVWIKQVTALCEISGCASAVSFRWTWIPDQVRNDGKRPDRGSRAGYGKARYDGNRADESGIFQQLVTPDLIRGPCW